MNHLLQGFVYFAVGFVVCYVVGRLFAALLRRWGFDELFITPWKPVLGRKKSDKWKASSVVGWAVNVTGLLFCVAWLAQLFVPSDETVRIPSQLVLIVDSLLYFCGQGWLLLLTSLVALWIARIVAEAVISVFQNKTIRNQLELFCPHTESPSVAREKAEGQVADLEVDLEAGSEAASGEQASDEQASVKETIAGFANETVEPASSNNQPVEAFADTIARLVGMLVYLMVFVPVFMIAAGLWQWSVAWGAFSGVWVWLLPYVGFGVVVLLGWFVVTAAVMAIVPASQRRFVMIGTAMLAMLLLVASFNTILAVIFSIGFGVAIWVTRNDLPDAMAAWYLQSKVNLSAKTSHGQGRITCVQLLTSDLETVQGVYRVRNRHILRSYLDGETISDSRLVPVNESISEAVNETETAAESTEVSE